HAVAGVPADDGAFQCLSICTGEVDALARSSPRHSGWRLPKQGDLEMNSIVESRWLSRGIILVALALAAWVALSSGPAFAEVVFDPEPEEIPGMGGLSTFINYTAWGVAIICGVAFLGT